MACNFASDALHLMQPGRKLIALVLILSAYPVLSQSGDVLPQSVPTIASVQWDPVAAGGTQCATGSGFGDSPGTLSLGGSGATPSQWSDTQVCLAIPPATPAGTAALRIATVDDSATSISFTVTAAIPSVSSIVPATTGAGMPVTITGSSFGVAQNGSTVQIGGQNLQITSWTDAQIVAIVPPGIAPNNYPLNVTVHGFTAAISLRIVGRPEIFFVLTDPVAVTGTECAWGVGLDAVPGSVSLNGTILSPSLWSLFQACFMVPANTAPGGGKPAGHQCRGSEQRRQLRGDHCRTLDFERNTGQRRRRRACGHHRHKLRRLPGG
jgi:hypothetical protein